MLNFYKSNFILPAAFRLASSTIVANIVTEVTEVILKKTSFFYAKNLIAN